MVISYLPQVLICPIISHADQRFNWFLPDRPEIHWFIHEDSPEVDREMHKDSCPDGDIHYTYLIYYIHCMFMKPRPRWHV